MTFEAEEWHRRLLDFMWLHCDHEDVDGHGQALVCWECAFAMIQQEEALR